MTPRFSDLSGTTGDRFSILGAGASEGDLCFFDANQAIRREEGISFASLIGAILGEQGRATDAEAALQALIDDLTARVTALETP